MRPIGALFEGAIELTIEFAARNANDKDYKQMGIKKEKSRRGRLVLAFSCKLGSESKSSPKFSLTINNKPFNNVPQYLKDHMPRFAYHDDFSFEVPEVIDFSNSSRNDVTNLLWQEIFDDVFALSTGTEEKFKKGVIELSQQGGTAANVVSNRINSMQRYLNEHIGKVWRDLTGGQTWFKGFNIRVSPQNRFHYSLEVEDNDSVFPVSTRSKGFKWFICFVLMSEIKSARRNSGGTIFLLDEPANNIHIARQGKILESLLTIAQNDDSILFYSTHSPSLIDIDKTHALYCRGKENEQDPTNIQVDDMLPDSDDSNIMVVFSSEAQKSVVAKTQGNIGQVRKKLKAQMNRENVRTASTLVRDIINAIPAIFT